MRDYAILNGHEVVECDFMTSAEWFGRTEKERIVAKTTLQGFLVSTVFLGVDYSRGVGPKLWFETMIFQQGQWSELYCERYSTWDEALAGHRAACEAVRNKEIAE